MARRRSWDPITDLVTMQQAMDHLVDDAWTRRSIGWREGERVAALPLDVYSTGEELVIKASVPGVAPENLEITIEGDTLTIKGETKAPLDNVDYHLQERRYGAFGRTLTLNVPVEADQAEANFENGELTLVIPKAQEVRPKVIKVKSK
jgi:HSP20 family protein